LGKGRESRERTTFVVITKYGNPRVFGLEKSQLKNVRKGQKTK
jgi:hypothetical protein